jgi:acetyltransferase-like isoleucine patch superfamily enzyme
VQSEAAPAASDVIIGFPSTRTTNCEPPSLPHDAVLRPGTVLYEGTSFGRRFTTGHNVIVREDVIVGDDVSIWSNTVIDYSSSIGDRVKIHCNCYVAQFTRIDADAFLAPGVTIANDLFPGDEASAIAMQGPWIGAHAQIGANVTILPFVHIGEGSVIGAGSVVTRSVPEGVLAYGNPARVTRRVDEIDVAERIREARARLRWTATGAS